MHTTSENEQNSGQWEIAVLGALVVIAIAFNAIMLLPELQPIPTHNDSAWHYMFVQGASNALAQGDNPFDFWVPDLALGFPQFLYYQHLPHLAVVLLNRLLLRQVDLLTLFNLIRYLLLVGFPLTVYWSMRTMEFSDVASVVGAVCGSLLSAESSYGFDYQSYVWNGFGLYTQLWAMHLSFISLACLWRLQTKGTGYLSAVAACSMLALSHVLYASMTAITVFALLLLSPLQPRSQSLQVAGQASPAPVAPLSLRALQCVVRLAIVGAIVAVITAYFWLPFLLFRGYVRLPPQLNAEFAILRHSSSLIQLSILPLNWQLLDHGRLPVLTVMLVLGLGYATACACAAFSSATPARLALLVFAVWLALYMGLWTWPSLASVLRMRAALFQHRSSGCLDLGAILVIGLGGECLWRWFAPLAEPWRAVVPGLIILALIGPAVRERSAFYRLNARKMARTLDTEPDWRVLVATLRGLPPARTYSVVPLFNKLTFYDIVTIYPGPLISLNSDLYEQFDDHDPSHYNLFNTRYVIAPSSRPVPRFLTEIKRTPRFTLYRAETSGYAQFAAVSRGEIAAQKIVDAQRVVLEGNRAWLQSRDPGAGKFILWDYPPGRRHLQDKPGSGGPGSGTVTEESVSPGRIDLSVDSREAATLVIKITYHPNWRVMIDGKERPTFMLSPSYLGVQVPSGHHRIRAEYRSGLLKKVLLLLSACTLAVTICLRRRLDHLEKRILRHGHWPAP